MNSIEQPNNKSTSPTFNPTSIRLDDILIEKSWQCRLMYALEFRKNRVESFTDYIKRLIQENWEAVVEPIIDTNEKSTDTENS